MKTIIAASIRPLLKPGIQRRLALGYLLTIGLAATGVQLGHIFASQMIKQPAQRRLEETYQYSERLSELQKGFLGSKSMILAYIRRPELINDYSQHLLNSAQRLQHLINQIATDSHFTETQSRPGVSLLGSEQLRMKSATQQVRLDDFLTDCQTIGLDYENSLEQLLSQLSPDGQMPDDIQANLLNFMGDSIMSQLEQCSLALETLIRDNRETILTASRALELAHQLQSRITQTSLLASLLVAITLALYNSSAIARPLTAVSRVAQRVSQQDNFSLRAPVYHDDEIGVVAISLNALIARVKDLLHEQQETQQHLEIYNHKLESMVQERTQALYEKNMNLQQTVETLHETQAQLIQAEKMSSLGQLVAGIAHEVNNPVSFIHGNLQHAKHYVQDMLDLISLYQMYSPPNEQIEDKLEEIDLAFLEEDVTKLLQSMSLGTERIREIVLSLRNFSRLDESDCKMADIHEGIDSTLLILGHRLKSDNPEQPAIKVTKHYALSSQIECFPGQLNQVFMNILVNAIDALEAKRLAVKKLDTSASPEAIFPHGEINISTAQLDENRFQVLISDNGIGMTETVKNRVFEPFFTTKDVGQGTGMGLSISYKIVTERHRGWLRCESELGAGTTFVIELPTRLPKAHTVRNKARDEARDNVENRSEQSQSSLSDMEREDMELDKANQDKFRQNELTQKDIVQTCGLAPEKMTQHSTALCRRSLS